MSVDRMTIPRWECLQLLDISRVGRICIVDHGYPVALPVNFRLIGTGDECEIVIRTGPDTMIGRYTGLASFEVDHIDLDAQEAWSVLACGRLRHEPGAGGLPDPHPWLDERHHWMVLSTERVSGRRFVGVPSADGVTVDWELRAT